MVYVFLQILSLMESVHQAQQHVQQLWQHKKMRLDQCFQLRLFEQDVEKVIIGRFYFAMPFYLEMDVLLT